MPRFGILLSFVLALAACSSHNPFENTRGDFRIDGTFVNFKTAGLPGTYAAEQGADWSYMTLSEDGPIEFLLPSNEPDCQLRVRGELVSVRQIPKSSTDETVEFRFGNFKAEYSSENTHVLVVLLDVDLTTEPPTVALENLYKGEPVQEDLQTETDGATAEAEDGSSNQNCTYPDLANHYYSARGLFLLPVQWGDGELGVGDTLWLKE